MKLQLDQDKFLKAISNSLILYAVLVFLTGISLPAPATASHPAVRSNKAGELFSPEVRAFSVDPQPMVSITFDDYSHTVYDAGFPILNGHGIPATFYFISSGLDSQWITELTDLQNHGWEIGSHSRTHPNLTTLSEADLITELNQSKVELQAAGLNVSGFAYPGGQGPRNGTVFRKVKQYYSYARSVASGYNTPIIKQYDLRTQLQTSSTTIGTMKGWVDSAIANHQWLIITMHTVDTTGSIYSISPDDLTSLADYIETQVNCNCISAVTVQEGVSRYGLPGWTPIAAAGDPIHKNLVITNGQALWWLGQEAIDYLNDGYEWVESGALQYSELNGDYHTASIPSTISLSNLRSDLISAQFTLTDSTDGNFQVTNTVSLIPGSPFGEVKVTAIQGTALSLSNEKWMARRFSVYQGGLVTDGLIETGSRNYGKSDQVLYSFNDSSDLIRLVVQPKGKTLSEYADYEHGLIRIRSISKSNDLPFLWFTGGIPFDTHHLLSEAENGLIECQGNYYTGEDASPKTGNTGIVLSGCNHWMNISFTPPYPGNYVLSLRQKGSASSDTYGYRIDGGVITTRVVTGTTFGYENIQLANFSAQSHTLEVTLVSGTVDVDYVLLIPITRSETTPVDVDFPIDISHQLFHYCYLPIILH